MKLALELSDEVDNNIWWLGLGYETGPTQFLESFIHPGMVFWDIGANIGYYTLLAASLIGPIGQVCAFEPMPSTYRKLRQNVGLNPDFTSILTHQIALSDLDAVREIYSKDPTNSGSSSLVFESGAKPISLVNAMPLDTFLQTSGLRSPDLIKIDVEGHELAVLKGASQTLRNIKPHLLVEVRDHFLGHGCTDRDAIYDLLMQAKYVPYRILKDGQTESIAEPEDGTLVLFSPA